MIYSTSDPRYYELLSSPIPERLSRLPQFIKYFNLDTENAVYD